MNLYTLVNICDLHIFVSLCSTSGYEVGRDGGGGQIKGDAVALSFMHKYSEYIILLHIIHNKILHFMKKLILEGSA